MPCGQSVFSLYYLSRQYSQNVFLVPIISVLRSIVENSFMELPEGLNGLPNRAPAGRSIAKTGYDSVKSLSSRPSRLSGSK